MPTFEPNKIQALQIHISVAFLSIWSFLPWDGFDICWEFASPWRTPHPPLIMHSSVTFQKPTASWLSNLPQYLLFHTYLFSHIYLSILRQINKKYLPLWAVGVCKSSKSGCRDRTTFLYLFLLFMMGFVVYLSLMRHLSNLQPIYRY